MALRRQQRKLYACSCICNMYKYNTTSTLHTYLFSLALSIIIPNNILCCMYVHMYVCSSLWLVRNSFLSLSAAFKICIIPNQSFISVEPKSLPIRTFCLTLLLPGTAIIDSHSSPFFFPQHPFPPFLCNIIIMYFGNNRKDKAKQEAEGAKKIKRWRKI